MDLDRILAKPLAGDLLSEDEAAGLLRLPHEHRGPVYAAADRLNRDLNGDRVSWVFNRNINFTNACSARCGFCAYRVEPDDTEAYVLTPQEAVDLAGRTPGIDEVCLVGGLNPAVSFDQVLEIFAAVHAAYPHIHIHALSPMEVEWYAQRSGLTIQRTFEKLREAGYGSLCGTAAEILVDEVRREICPAKLSTARWVEIVRTAHRMGIRSTSTILFGHIERPEHVARHLRVLRDLQAETGGITEFIPLPFVPYHTPLGRSRGISEMVGKEEAFLLYAVARLFFGRLIPNVQVSWVKLGLATAAESFRYGVNDLGGTLLAENITRTAGGRHGESLSPAELISAIRSAGRTPVRRDTLYHPIGAVEHFPRGGFAGPEASALDATSWPPFCCVAAFVAASLEKLGHAHIDRKKIALELGISVAPTSHNPWNLQVEANPLLQGLTVAAAETRIPRLLMAFDPKLSFRHVPLNHILLGLVEDFIDQATRQGRVLGIGYDANRLDGAGTGVTRHVARLEPTEGGEAAVILDDSASRPPSPRVVRWSDLLPATNAIHDGFWIIGHRLDTPGIAV
jgi:5-amino-6-(D-ribitylamino)uracil---L-tyrosine 4-hydroxyphenyl transferase